MFSHFNHLRRKDNYLFSFCSFIRGYILYDLSEKQTADELCSTAVAKIQSDL